MKYPTLLLLVTLLAFASCKKESENIIIPEIPLTETTEEEEIVEYKLPFAAIGRKFTYERKNIKFFYTDTVLDTGIVEILKFQPPNKYIISDPKRIFGDKDDILEIDSNSIKFINGITVITPTQSSGYEYYVAALDTSVMVSTTRKFIELAFDDGPRVTFSREYGVVSFRDIEYMSGSEINYTLIKIED